MERASDGLEQDEKVWGESKQCTIYMYEIFKEQMNFLKAYVFWESDWDSLVNLLISSQ